MEAFLKKYGLNESEIIEFKEHALSVNPITIRKNLLKEKLSKLSITGENSKGTLILCSHQMIYIHFLCSKI